VEEDERGKIHCTYWRDGKNKQNLNMMGRNPFRRLRHRWDHNIKMNLK
jgi:hypothetical protein